MSFIKEMYWFDGYSTPITHLVLGAYFPSILLFDFYSVCLDTYVYNLYTVRKLALRAHGAGLNNQRPTTLSQSDEIYSTRC